MTIFIAACIFR